MCLPEAHGREHEQQLTCFATLATVGTERRRWMAALSLGTSGSASLARWAGIPK